MTHSFDPYHQWLGIRDKQRPPNFYRLLGLELFEADLDVIATAADRQMAHLRTYQIGPHSALSQQLLNEVSSAKACLLDVNKKARYDEQLRQEWPTKVRPLESGELFDEQNREVVVRQQPVSLRPPGRGPRGERPWYASMTVLLPVLGVVLCLTAYRVYRDYFRSAPHESAAVSDTSTPTPAPVPPGDRQSSNIAQPNDAEDAPGEGTSALGTTDENRTSAAEQSEGSEAPSPAIAAADDGSETKSDGSPDTTVTKTSSDSSDETSRDDQSVGHELAVTEKKPRVAAWDPAAIAFTGSPAQFTTQQPMGPFLLAMAQRDVAAADSALQALRVHRALGLPESLFSQAELVRATIVQFWEAVDTSLATLAEGDSLSIGEVDSVVIKRDAASVTLESTDGSPQVWDLDRAKLHRDLAIGLVQRQYASSPPIAWRLIATFLAVDHQGDLTSAERWAQHAELRGFAATFLTEIVRTLSHGRAMPALEESTPTTIPVADAESIEIGETAAEALPDAEQQKQARREVLAPILAELRQQQVPSEQWARQLLERATSTDLTASARFVLLDNALSRARSRRDTDTALAVIDVLSRDFKQSRADLRYELLQALTRRLKGDQRRPYAELAQSMARSAVASNDYDEGIRFASLAQSIGRSIPDRFFRRFLLDFRLEIDAIRKAYESLKPPQGESGKETASPIELARFRVLSQGDFESEMTDLQATDDAALHAVVEQELARPDSPDDQRLLAKAWLQLSDQLSSVEAINALRRAQFWYVQCLAGLNRSQRIEAQYDLDKIASVLGRPTSQLDLTSVPPMGASVGYGTFGINENLDLASNPKVGQLPEVEGRRADRYFWACAPSRIEFLVPKGAAKFRAIGVVNAATQDGVQFVVKADGQVRFVSQVMKVMGGQVPIQVDLPDGTETLELIVDPQKSNVFDHTYWVDPQVLF